MTTPDPTCVVKDGSGSYQATTSGASVTVGNTVTIAVASTAGVDTWTCTITSTDETAPNPTITVNAGPKTATFTAPAAGSTMIFTSTVATAGIATTYATTFIIYTLTSGGKRVVALGETTQAGTYGWLTAVNAPIRVGGAGGAVDTYANIIASSAANNGAIRFPSDGGYPLVADGTTWRSQVGARLLTRPAVAASGWTQFGSPGSFSDVNGGIVICNQGVTDAKRCGGYRAITANTSTGTIELAMSLSGLNVITDGQHCGVGIVLLESGTGKIAVGQISFTGLISTGALALSSGGNDATLAGTSFTVRNYATAVPIAGNVLHFKVVFASTQLEIYASWDGLAYWGVLASINKTTLFTTIADNVGAYIIDNGQYQELATILQLKQSA